MNNKFTLVIADPGLETASGHHAGIATYLASKQCDDIPLMFFGNKAIAPSLYHRLISSGCELFRHFTTSHYLYYGTNDPHSKTRSSADLHSYISLLCKEYSAIFVQLAARNNAERFVLCYHTLHWEHAGALALALRRCHISPGYLRHIALLMFNPAIDYRGEITDAKQCLNFRMSINALHNCSNAEIFVSDTELARGYQQLLDLPQPLHLHPCFLADWHKLSRPSLPLSSSTGPSRITLYLGDAKPEKGFHKLPALLKGLLPRIDEQTELLIQYTFNDEDPCISSTVYNLQALALKDDRLTLHCGFWSNHELHDELRQTDLMIFTYDGDAYRDKNSGLLWLLGWYRCPLLFLEPSWLTREAGRLGLIFSALTKETSSVDKISEQIRILLKKSANGYSRSSKNEKIEEYRHQIYYDFYEWIAERFLPTR